jgi:hypothetical protein
MYKYNVNIHLEFTPLTLTRGSRGKLHILDRATYYPLNNAKVGNIYHRKNTDFQEQVCLQM